MLSPADAQLVARDPQLPGLATVLDPECLVAAIQTSGGPRLNPGRICYVRYKPGISCLVGHQLTVDGIVVTVSGTAIRPGAGEKLAKAKSWSANRPAGSLFPIVIDDCAVILFSFPDDVELNALPVLNDDETRYKLLRKLLPAQENLWSGTLTPIRYKPERRFVARLDVAGEPQAVLKVYTRSGFPAAERNAKAFASTPAVRCPERIGRSNRHHVLALEWLPGQLLLDLLTQRDFKPNHLVSVGEALAAFQNQPGKLLNPRPIAQEIGTLDSSARWISHVCPELAPTVRSLAERIADRLQQIPLADSAVHGDFYSKQVLVGEGPVAIIDYDEGSRGDPAYDLGTFQAHLERDAIRGLVPKHNIGPAFVALLSGYGSTGCEINLRNVAVHTAAALLRLAPHPFRNREPNWPAATAELLERADAVLKSAERTTEPKAVAV